MKISEIFYSINGEGKFAGLPTVFIRTHGCNLRCDYCDSMYAVTGDDYTEMSTDNILAEVDRYRCKRITLTGGEPLLQQNAITLVTRLLSAGYSVEIETNGAIDISSVANLGVGDRCVVTMDWKCPSSKMKNKMLYDNLKRLHSNDVLKCVVSSIEDLDEMKHVAESTFAKIYVSPVFGQIDPKDIVQYVLDNHLNSVHVQLQLHKMIWPADMRGV